MSLWVIADLHLCQGNPEKTMSVFRGWNNYQELIEKNWSELVKPDDTVVIAGDISWGMSLQESAEDFHFIENLPG
ncbi:MAG: metallophosphoesterase, partial [Ruminococcus sp.]|nr:metallophosphoesterase [Ruminococcus sp.]